MSRYVDADNIWKEACNRFEFVDDFMEILDAVPTADVRENIHGEWIQAKELGSCIYMCSECGETWDIFSGAMPLPNYCPNCGARMVSE